jgi:hypothetical protein
LPASAGDLLAAVHRDLDQPVVERGIGEALEQRIGIGGQIHAGAGGMVGRLLAHQRAASARRQDRPPPDA